MPITQRFTEHRADLRESEDFSAVGDSRRHVALNIAGPWNNESAVKAFNASMQREVNRAFCHERTLPNTAGDVLNQLSPTTDDMTDLQSRTAQRTHFCESPRPITRPPGRCRNLLAYQGGRSR